MRYERLRDLPTAELLAEMYREPHDHRRWGYGHSARVDRTINLARKYVPMPLWSARVADLSCGNGAIAYSIGRSDDEIVLGDYAPGCQICGPIEETLDLIEPVDVFICCETLEHVEDPDAVLAHIRSKTVFLVASTPIDNWGDTNSEHLHSYDREYVEDMFTRAGFDVVAFDHEDARAYDEHYDYGIWVCKS